MMGGGRIAPRDVTTRGYVSLGSHHAGFLADAFATGAKIGAKLLEPFDLAVIPEVETFGLHSQEE